MQYFTSNTLQHNAHSTMPYEAILTVRCLRFTRNTPHYNAHSLMPHIEIPHKQYLTTKCPESEFRCLTSRSLRCDPYNPTPHAQYLTTQCPQSDALNPMSHKGILAMPTIRRLMRNNSRCNAQSPMPHKAILHDAVLTIRYLTSNTSQCNTSQCNTHNAIPQSDAS